MRLSSTILLLWSASAMAQEPIRSDSVRSGSLKQRLVTDDADLVLFYAAEQEGELGTCGCDESPRGSMSRLQSYVQASRLANPLTPSLLLNAGAWASSQTGSRGELSPEAEIANNAMVLASEEAGFDALNASYRDTLWFRTHAVPDRVVSTNIEGGGAPVRYVKAGDLTVAVLGVSRPGNKYLQSEELIWTDPVQAVVDALPGVVERSDLVVLLAFDVGKDANRFANLPGVDVLIEASIFRAQDPPWFEGGRVWVRANYQTQRVGELRLWLDDGAVVAVYDRLIDLDERIPEVRAQKRIARDAQRQLDALSKSK